MLQSYPSIPVALPDSVPDVKQELGMLRSLPIDELIDTVVSSLIKFSINLAIAIVVFYVGKLIINKIFRMVSSLMVRRRVDRSLSTFVMSLIRMVLYFILIVTVIGIMGIETSSFIAIFASAGVAIGMALSGTLQNFAGGVLILLLKPYKVGDYIETQGYAGFVREIQIFHTIICTYDNKSIILPNGGLSTGSINNWSREDYRRVEWPVAISYGDDVEAARAKILQIIDEDSRVVKKYIEDDRELRKIDRLEAQATDGDAAPEQAEKRVGWFRRIFYHQHDRMMKKMEDDRAEAERLQQLFPRADRSPSVVVDQLADSSVILKARAWTHTDFYWPVLYDINERIYKELPQDNIHFPFPQLDVHYKPV